MYAPTPNGQIPSTSLNKSNTPPPPLAMITEISELVMKKVYAVFLKVP